MRRRNDGAPASAASRALVRTGWTRTQASAWRRYAGRCAYPRKMQSSPPPARTRPHRRAGPGRSRCPDRPRVRRRWVRALRATHRRARGRHCRAARCAPSASARPARRDRHGVDRRDRARRRRTRRATPRPSHREAAAAAAGGLRVGIADDELRALQAFAVVDFRTHQVLQAERIDEQRDAVAFHRHVVLAPRLVELEAVLEARAPAALDVHAQLELRIAFLGDQLANLGGGGRRELQRRIQLLPGGGGGEANGIEGGLAHARKMRPRPAAIKANGGSQWAGRRVCRRAWRFLSAGFGRPQAALTATRAGPSSRVATVAVAAAASACTRRPVSWAPACISTVR